MPIMSSESMGLYFHNEAVECRKPVNFGALVAFPCRLASGHGGDCRRQPLDRYEDPHAKCKADAACKRVREA